MSHLVHYAAGVPLRSRSGRTASPADALRDELRAVVCTLEERRRWKPGTAPRALVAHARQLSRQLAKALACVDGTVRREAEAIALQRRLDVVEAAFGAHDEADVAGWCPRDARAPNVVTPLDSWTKSGVARATRAEQAARAAIETIAAPIAVRAAGS